MKLKLKPITSRFSSFGGMKLIQEYSRMGLLPGILSQTVQTIARGHSLEDVVDYTYAKVDKFLQEKYRPLMFQLIKKYNNIKGGTESSSRIWSCWLQGLEHAPLSVKTCLASQKKFITDKEHIIITLDTYKQYVSLPAFIEEKYKQGKIPPALFSDLIRLELLIKHGGTWIDSTVLCTGNHYPKEYLDCDLFMFQYIRSDGKTFAGISNWFISAKSNNKLLLILRDMLYQYWRDYDCTLEYYIFHRFFYMIAKEYPDEIAAMPKGYNPTPLWLARRFNDEYDEKWMQMLTDKCCFHKTTYRISQQTQQNKNSFYSRIMEMYSNG